MDVWLLVLYAGASLLAVQCLVRLMAQRRGQLLGEQARLEEQQLRAEQDRLREERAQAKAAAKRRRTPPGSAA